MAEALANASIAQHEEQKKPGRTPSSAERGLSCEESRSDAPPRCAEAALGGGDFRHRSALARAAEADDLYDVGRFGNARVLHMTDTHAQLEPVHFREPSVNLGVGAMAGKPPHLVGEAFLKHFGIAPKSRLAHAFTYLDYERPRTATAGWAASPISKP